MLTVLSCLKSCASKRSQAPSIARCFAAISSKTILCTIAPFLHKGQKVELCTRIQSKQASVDLLCRHLLKHHWASIHVEQRPLLNADCMHTGGYIDGSQMAGESLTLLQWWCLHCPLTCLGPGKPWSSASSLQVLSEVRKEPPEEAESMGSLQQDSKRSNLWASEQHLHQTQICL